MISRKEKEYALKKEWIADTACRLFQEHSFDSVTVAEIARKAEFGKGTLYQYFRSKEEILVHVICQGFNKLGNDLDEARSESNDPTLMLEQFIELQYQFDLDYQSLFLAMYRHIMDGALSEQVLHTIGEYHQLKHQRFISLLEWGQNEGRFILRDTEELARAIENTVKGFSLGNLEQDGGDLEKSRDLTSLKHVLLSAVLQKA